MERVKLLTIMLSAALIVLVPETEAQPHQRPLCVSQFALVNYACSVLPYSPPMPPSLNDNDEHQNEQGHMPPISSPPSLNGDDEHQDEDGLEPPSLNDDHDDGEHQNEHDHRHGHGGHGHGHHRRHGHRHRHRHRGVESPVQANCCRWLKELDDECVCDLLVHLPPFLSKPAHQYTMMVDDSCNVTYTCGMH